MAELKTEQRSPERELNGLPGLAQENPHVYFFSCNGKFWIAGPAGAETELESLRRPEFRRPR
ncbi:MAG TPA: hypothetical protein PLG50_13185 [bacterium]|nr:hypothetical protein [bacterium]